MNKETFKGNWNILKGKVKQQWGKLTDDDVARLSGSYDEFEGLLQKKYGMKKEEAKTQIDAWLKKSGIKETSTY